MKYRELKRYIDDIVSSAKSFAGIYCIYGDDAYLRETAYGMLSKAIIEDEFRDMNIATFIPDDGIQNIFDSANELPFFGAYRICKVVLSALRNEDGQIDKKNSKITNNFIDALSEYSKNINPATVLIVSFDNKDPIKKMENIEYIDCTKLDMASLSLVIQEILDNEPTCQMDSDAKQALIERTSGDMTRISNEIPKLKAYTNGAKITLKDVEEQVFEDTEYAIYALSTAVALKQSDEALKILNVFLANGKNGFTILNSIYAQYRNMLHCSLHAKDTDEEIQNMLGISKGQVYYVRKNIKEYTQLRLKKSVDTIHNLQTAVLSGEKEANGALYEGVLSLLTI